MTDEQRRDAEERLTLIKDAGDYQSLVEHPGWIKIYNLHVEWVEQARRQLLTIDTSDANKALDALRRWQLAETLVNLEASRINDTFEAVKQIRGTVTLDDALLMEKLRHEQSESSGDPGGTGPNPSPAGY